MKINTIHLLGASLGIFALLCSPLSAKPDKGKGGGKGKGGQKTEHSVQKFLKPEKHLKFDKKEKKQYDREASRFDPSERDLISSLFAPKSGRNLPPGLAKNLQRGKPLPPGWQDKLSPGSRMDESWLSSFTPIGYDLLLGMRPIPNTQLYRYDNRLVRVLNSTREILDVISIP